MRLNPRITIRRKSWNARRLTKEAKREAALRLDLAAQYIRSYIVRSLSKPYPPASKPFTEPHARSGRLRGSIVSPPTDPDELVARVGTTVQYGKFLEAGTKRMKPRPFVAPALIACRKMVARLLTYRGHQRR